VVSIVLTKVNDACRVFEDVLIALWMLFPISAYNFLWTLDVYMIPKAAGGAYL
jgi:hypothetical protein